VNDLPIIKVLLFPPRESYILTRISREFVKSSKDDAYALGTRDILCYSFWVWNFLWCLHLSKKDISRYFASFDHILPRLVVWETSAVEILMTLSTQFTRLKHSLVQSLLNSWPGQGIDTMEHFAVRGTYSCRMTQQSHSYPRFVLSTKQSNLTPMMISSGHPSLVANLMKPWIAAPSNYFLITFLWTCNNFGLTKSDVAL